MTRTTPPKVGQPADQRQPGVDLGRWCARDRAWFAEPHARTRYEHATGRDRWLLVWAAFFFVLTALPDGAAFTQSNAGPPLAELPPDPWTAIVERLPVQPVIMLLGPIGFACPFLLGLWAGRRRILEHPHSHRRLLAIVAVAGITASVLGAQPVSLMLAGTGPLPGEDAYALARALHAATGVLGRRGVRRGDRTALGAAGGLARPRGQGAPRHLDSDGRAVRSARALRQARPVRGAAAPRDLRTTSKAHARFVAIIITCG